MKRRRYKQLLIDEPFQVFRNLTDFGETPGGLFITDDPSRNPLPKGWTRVDVSYDQRSPRDPTEISLPYGIHPGVHASGVRISREQSESGEGRWCRLFFAGQAQPGWYDRPDIARHFGLMNRLEVIETAQAASGSQFRSAPPPEQGSPFFQGFHLMDGGTRISEGGWLEVLHGSDVFLACPGRTIPLAHSVIEALSVGAIPLLQHPDQFDPPLEDGKNALVFRDAEHLTRRTDEILRMSPEAIAALRKGAVEYYHRYLHPERVVERLTERVGEPRTTLLYNWFLAPKEPRF